MQKSISPLPGSESPRVTALDGSFGPRWFSVPARALAAAVAVVLACACSKPPPPPEPTPPPTPEATPVPTPTPTPTLTPTPAPTATPVAHHYAPEGVFYVTEDLSVTLSSGHGILGVVAGTPVKLVKDNGDLASVSDGSKQFDIKKSQLTNDLDEAATILKRTRAIEAVSDAARAEQDAVVAKQRRDQLEYLKAHPLAQPTPEVTPRR